MRKSRRHPVNDISLFQAYDYMRSDYNAAKTGRLRKRLTGVSVMGSGSDYHYRNESDFLRMMELARSIDRNDMIVGQGVTRLIDNVLQQGMKLDPQTGNDELDADLRQRWDDWAMDPDACHKAGEQPFNELARLALRHVIVDGDHIVLPSKDGTLEMVEAHRCRRPRTQRNVVHGVLLDKYRRRLEYWLTKEDVDPNRTVKVGDMEKYPARDKNGNRQVFHLYNPKRVSQTRGITAFAPIIDPIGMHDDIQFAKLVQQQICSCFAIFRQREATEGVMYGDAPQQGERTTDTLADGSARSIEGIAPGMEVTGAPGETLQGFSPNVPNPEFFQHAMLVLSIIAVNLNLPVQALLLDGKQTNFSGWRGAMDQARIGFRTIQQWLAAGFHRRVYAWKVRQWLKSDPTLLATATQLNTAEAIYRHRWSPPGWAYIEPAKDAKADKTIVESHLDSRRGVLTRRGLDLDLVDREQIADTGRRIELAIVEADRLNQAYPDANVDWHEVAGMTAQNSPAEPDNDESEDDSGRSPNV